MKSTLPPVKNYCRVSGWRIAMLILTFQATFLTLQAQVSQTFDATGWGGSYGNYTVGGWTITNGFRETSNQRSGAAAVRLRDGSGAKSITTPTTGGGVGTITFWYRHWDGATPTINYIVETSPDASSWTTVANINGISSTTYVQFTLNVNSSTANYVRLSWVSGNERLIVDDFSVTAYAAPSGPTITTSSISGSPFCVGNTITASVSVPYTITGTFNSGNTFTAQLSNASGSFASPTTIGTLSSTTGGTISATIPASAGAGTGYRIRVVGSNPSTTGTDNGSNLTVQNYAGPTATAASCGNTIADVSWSNPTCFDQIMVVAKASAFTSALPTGDGSAYTASLTFGSGTAFDGGSVVYKNTGTSTGNITGLTNGTTYYFKTYARKGTVWVVGGTDNCAPATGPCGTESFSNATAPSSTYGNGSYTGDNGITWTYYEARSPSSTYDITGATIGFSDAGTGYVRANSGSGGVGQVAFSMRSYFSGGDASDRTIAVYVNGSLKGTYTLAAMGTIYTHIVTANESGNVLIEFRSTGSRQVVIDDISWTCAVACATVADPVGTISGTTPACATTSLSFSGSATSPVVNYWQTTATGTATTHNAASNRTVTSSGSYYVRAYNSSTNCWSDGAIGPYAVTINNNASISSQPPNRTIFTNDNTTFTVTASNANGYQWQVDTGSGFGNITNGGVYSGATTATLTITSAPNTMTGYQYRVVIGGNSPCSGITSNASTLTVIPAYAITDNGCQTEDYTELTVNYPTNVSITDINVGVKATTTWRGDLIIKLVSPSGTEVTLLNSVGGSADNLDALFDDAGTANALSSGNHTVDGTYDVTAQVEGALTDQLSTFNGEPAQGTWTLRICDAEDLDLAYLNSFELFITGCTPTNTISSFVPTSGPVGTMVTITGTGFTGTSAVKFGTINATSFTVVNSTTITAEVPTNAIDGRISVFNATNCPVATATSFTVIDASGTCGNGTTATELFISEIYDATSGDYHFVEIFNGTASSVNLSTYSVRVIAYGNNGSNTEDISLSGTLASGSTYLLRIGNSSGPCSVTANQTSTTGGFNGNDEIMLRKSGVTIDFTENPNTGAGFSQVRKSSVTAPSATYVASQWNISSSESCTDLGTGPYAAGPSLTITSHPTDVTGCSISMGVAATASTGVTYQWKYNDGTASGWANVTTFSGMTVTGTSSSTLTITGTTSSLSGYQFYCQITAGTCVKNSNAAQFTFGVLPVFRSKANGNWNNIATWEMANTTAGPWSNACDYPVAANSTEVIIKAGTSVVINIDITIDKLTIENTAALEMLPSAELAILNGQAGADLIVNGMLTDRGSSSFGLLFEDNTGTANDATWILGSTGTIIKTNTSSVTNYRDFYQGGISTIPATANWYYRYNGDGNPTTASADMYYPNLHFENTANTGNFAWNTFTLILSGRTSYCTVKGDLSLGVSGSGTVTVLNNNINSQPMLVLGDLYIEAGNTLTTEADPTLSSSNYGVSGGSTGTYGHGTGIEIRGSMLVEGTLDVNTASTGTLRFSGTGTQDVLGTGTLDLWDVDKTTSNTVALNMPIAVANTIMLRSGTFDAAGNDITIGGTWSNTGATYTHGNNTVIFNGAGNSTVRSNNQPFYNVQVATTGAGKVYPIAHDITVTNVLEVTQGALEIPASRTITVTSFTQSVLGTTTIKATGTLSVD